MDPCIPDDQLARIRPIVEQVLADLRALSATLADDSDSALLYSPAEGGE
jgi:hypothetical protein